MKNGWNSEYEGDIEAVLSPLSGQADPVSLEILDREGVAFAGVGGAVAAVEPGAALL